MSREDIVQPTKSEDLLRKEDLLFELIEEVARLRTKEFHAQGWYDQDETLNGFGQEEVILAGMMTGAVILTEHQMPMSANPMILAYSYDKLRITEMAAKGIAGDYASQ